MSLVYEPVLNALVASGARRATKYFSPTSVVKATRKLYGGRLRRKSETIDIVLTIGKPNYAERAFIKKLKTAGEPFPVRQIQLQFSPERRLRPQPSTLPPPAPGYGAAGNPQPSLE